MKYDAEFLEIEDLSKNVRITQDRMSLRTTGTKPVLGPKCMIPYVW